MFNSKKRMEQFKKEAEQKFSSFIGDDEFIGDDDFIGDNNFDGDATEGSLPKIDNKDRTLTFQIVNANSVDTAVNLFGAYEFSGAVNFGNATGITITLLESSYAALLAESNANPMYIKGSRLIASNVSQFSNPFTCVEKYSTGRSEQYIVQPNNYKNPGYFDNTYIDMKPADFSAVIGGRFKITFTLKAGITLTWIMYQRSRFDSVNVLQNKGAVNVAKSKNR